MKVDNKCKYKSANVRAQTQNQQDPRPCGLCNQSLSRLGAGTQRPRRQLLCTGGVWVWLCLTGARRALAAVVSLRRHATKQPSVLCRIAYGHYHMHHSTTW